MPIDHGVAICRRRCSVATPSSLRSLVRPTRGNRLCAFPREGRLRNPPRIIHVLEHFRLYLEISSFSSSSWSFFVVLVVVAAICGVAKSSMPPIGRSPPSFEVTRFLFARPRCRAERETMLFTSAFPASPPLHCLSRRSLVAANYSDSDGDSAKGRSTFPRDGCTEQRAGRQRVPLHVAFPSNGSQFVFTTLERAFHYRLSFHAFTILFGQSRESRIRRSKAVRPCCSIDVVCFVFASGVRVRKWI